MQVIELMEVWRSGQRVGSITGRSNDEFPEIVATLPECELLAGDRIRPLNAESSTHAEPSGGR